MKHFILFLFFLTPVLLGAQLLSEKFDGTNTANPAVISNTCTNSSTDYFNIVCVTGGGCGHEMSNNFSYGSVSGPFFGVRDADGSTSTPCTDISLAGETISFNSVDISSCGGANVLYVCFTAAESRNMGGAAGNEWTGSGGGREDTWDGSSFLAVTADIDGAGPTDVTAIQAFNGSDTRPGIDFDCSGKADGAGEPELTDVFTNYCFELPSFGTSLDLTFTIGELNTGGEDLALDDIEVYCTTDPSSLPGTLLAACTPFESNTCFFTEDFDGSNTTNPFVSTCAPGINGGDYFGVVCEDNACNEEEIFARFQYTNDDGQFFGARDINDADGCGSGDFGIFSTTGINISGAATQLYLCMDIAESNSDDENGSTSMAYDSWDGSSEVNIFTTIDGIEYFLTSLQSTDGTNTPPGFDTDCSQGSADLDILVTNTFTTVCFALASGGNSLDIAIEVTGLNTDGEDIAIDNISVCATSDPVALPGQVVPSCNIDRPLPVELISFRGEMTPKGASILSWETALEVENDYFDLEYSTNGETFSPIARIEGQGNTSVATSYSYEHKTLLAEINYYRLKQVDFDGTSTYSNVIALHQDMSEMKSLVYPNPASDVVIYVGAEATLTIFDAYGKRIRQIQTQTGAETIDVSDLRSGAYLIEIVKGDESREVKRFIKSN